MLRPIKIKAPPDRIWLTSDLHIGHNKPWTVQARGFTSIAEHDETLIRRWGETVTDDGVVFHLGDLMARSDCAGFWNLVRRLHFRNLVVLQGNHNSGVKQAYTEAVRMRFADLDNLDGTISAGVYPLTVPVDGDPGREVTFLPEYAEVTVGKLDLVLCHYGLASWHHMAGGALHFHGHSHNSLKPLMPRRVDVGIDHFGRPVSLADLVRLVGNQTPAVVDHHGRRPAATEEPS